MIYKLKNAVLINKLPTVIEEISAVAYKAAIPATATEPEIPEVIEVLAQPKKYVFEATAFIGIEGTAEGEFIQDKNFSFQVEGEKTLAEIGLQLLTEATNYMNTNYISTP